MAHTMAIEATASRASHANKYSGLHALQGLERQPVELSQPVMERLLWILAAAGELKSKIDQTYNRTFHSHLGETNALADSIRYNNYWQAATHLATAFGAVAIGGAAATWGMDAASAVSIVTKGGEGIGAGIRASETYMSHSKQQVDHKISKGSEGGKRLSDFLQQLMQSVRTYMEQHSQQLKPR